MSGGPTAAPGLLTDAELQHITEIQDQHKTQLRIPRRWATAMCYKLFAVIVMMVGGGTINLVV